MASPIPEATVSSLHIDGVRVEQAGWPDEWFIVVHDRSDRPVLSMRYRANRYETCFWLCDVNPARPTEAELERPDGPLVLRCATWSLMGALQALTWHLRQGTLALAGPWSPELVVDTFPPRGVPKDGWQPGRNRLAVLLERVRETLARRRYRGPRQTVAAVRADRDGWHLTLGDARETVYIPSYYGDPDVTPTVGDTIVLYADAGQSPHGAVLNGCRWFYVEPTSQTLIDTFR